AIDHRRGGSHSTSGGEPPQHRAGCGIEGIYIVVIRADIDHTIDHRRGGFDTTPGGKAPLLRTRCGVDGIDVAVTRADIDYVVDYGCGGRGAESWGGGEGPGEL